ncbi:hypothetical protein O9929_10600 [Vibrio lentus]|nr:hypothetical protein [Vibrio lentus]
MVSTVSLSVSLIPFGASPVWAMPFFFRLVPVYAYTGKTQNSVLPYLVAGDASYGMSNGFDPASWWLHVQDVRYTALQSRCTLA